MEEAGHTGVVTRSCSRMHARGERHGTGCKTPSTSLLSPQSRLEAYYAPSRKSQRLASRPSRDSLRQIRQRGHPGAKPGLTGLLGSLPVEVG